MTSLDWLDKTIVQPEAVGDRAFWVSAEDDEPGWTSGQLDKMAGLLVG